jgi:hypothetical protein
MPRFARPALFGFLLACLSVPAMAQQRLLDSAIDTAIASFETAWPRLEAEMFGVDTAAYRDALTLQRFQSAHWGGTVSVELAISGDDTGSCARFAAYTRIPPEGGTVRMVLCPQFFTPGADDLRALTILHEMVHVVAGADECQAMAFAARVQQAASGTFTPVDAYWKANGCPGTAFELP